MSHKIGIDVRMIQHTGIGTYVRGLLSGWAQLGVQDQMDLALYGNGRKFEDYDSIPKRPFRSKIYSVGEQIEYPWRLKDCRLWHAPHYNVPIVKGKTRLVVTIHDLIHWIFRKDFFSPAQEFYASFMFKRAATQADHVITVSNKTKNDLVTHFDMEPDRVSVIYEGVGESFRELSDPTAVDAVRVKYGIPENYFFYIGLLKPHKNVLWLIRLFNRLKKEKKIDASLVLVGKKDKKYPEGFEDLSALESNENVIHLPFVEEKELITLYNGAIALVHPSLYEGFGLTLLEAMACGTPVIACRSASIPEVVGDAAYLVESGDERDMTEALVRVEKRIVLREELKRKGSDRVTRFRWEDAAEKTAAVYEKVLSL